MKLKRVLGTISKIALVLFAATNLAACASRMPSADDAGDIDPEAITESVDTGTSVGNGMVQKATRGLVNSLTGWIEFPAQIYKGFDQGVGFIDNEVGSTVVGTVLGFFGGISHAAGRTGYGVLEFAGFWTASPADNEGVGTPLDAQYAWEYGTQYSIFEPTLIEGLTPYPRKILRGAGNGVLGIAEFPGQIIKGADDGNIALGVVKGVWFTMSRVHYGFSEMFGFLLPNPPDTRGYAFEQEWPWDALAGNSE